MNERRRIWTAKHGKIPKGWVVHCLNGDLTDLRIENLAAIPRYPETMNQILAPYKVRIRKLEEELKLKGDK